MTDQADGTVCSGIGGDILSDALAGVALELTVAGFAALWAGQARRPSDLIPGYGDTAAQVAQALAEQGRSELDHEGRLVGAHGLTLRTTRHRFVHNRRTHHTWCAFDAIGIPAALDLDALAHSDCPVCHRELEVSIDGGIPHSGAEPVLWLPAPTVTHLIADFCAHANLYCSVEHLQRRIGTGAPGEVLDLAAAATLGREVWANVAAVALAEETPGQ